MTILRRWSALSAFLYAAYVFCLVDFYWAFSFAKGCSGFNVYFGIGWVFAGVFLAVLIMYYNLAISAGVLLIAFALGGFIPIPRRAGFYVLLALAGAVVLGSYVFTPSPDPSALPCGAM
jgi:hypothetical protein